MNTGRVDASAAKSALGGAFISNTMMVMMTAITPSVKASSRPLCITDLSHSIERLAVEPNRDHDGRQREERDWPEFREDIRQAISLEQQAAHDPHRVRRGDDFASPLRPDRHALEREHEARKQKRR